jgi:hypothetical protein
LCLDFVQQFGLCSFQQQISKSSNGISNGRGEKTDTLADPVAGEWSELRQFTLILGNLKSTIGM